MLYSISHRLSKFLLLSLITGHAYAFDSSSAYNVVTMSYPSNQFIYNRVVLDSTQKAQGSFTFSADVKNGGGRPTHDLNGNPLAYSSQTDSAFLRVKMYDQAGTLVNTVQSQTYVLKNLGSDPNNQFSTRPGDNLQPWSNATVTYTGDLSNVRFLQIELVGTDGAFWAGNYGPMWRVPTVIFGNDTSNTVYNPEFGISPNSVKAQGWFNSSNSWATCGTTSGSTPCVTNESGVTANMWGGGYDINGGSLAGAVGGYDGTLSTQTADTAAATGDPSSGGSSPPPPPPPTPVYGSSGPTTIQQSVRNNALNENPQGHNAVVGITGDDNIVTIQQIGTSGQYAGVDIQGNDNEVLVEQIGSNGSRHYLNTAIIGNNNDLTLRQSGSNKTQFVFVGGNNNTITTNQKDTGSHFLNLDVTGDNHNVGIVQEGAGNHSANVVLGGSQPWNFELNQSGSANQNYTLPHGMSDGTTVNGSCAAVGGCNLTVNQQ
jgi:hypothetical protein